MSDLMDALPRDAELLSDRVVRESLAPTLRDEFSAIGVALSVSALVVLLAQMDHRVVPRRQTLMVSDEGAIPVASASEIFCQGARFRKVPGLLILQILRVVQTEEWLERGHRLYAEDLTIRDDDGLDATPG